MDAELSPSEEDIDSDETEEQRDSCIVCGEPDCTSSHKAPESEEKRQEPTTEPPEGAKVVGVLDMDRNLRPDLAWICFGLDREKNEVHLFVPDGEWPNVFELRGFVEIVVNPQFVLSRLKTTGEG